MKPRERTARAAAVVVAIALVGAGCGDSDDGGSEPAEPPVIPARVAEELAKRSDEVSAKLSEGDLCAAAHKADELVNEVDKAEKEIPSELHAELKQGAEQLQNTANCPPPPEEEDKDEEKDKEKEKDDEGEGGYADEPLLGEEGPGNSGNAPGHNKGGD